MTSAFRMVTLAVGTACLATRLFAAPAQPVDQFQTYLLSISHVGLKRGERVSKFVVTTWGVEFNAICQIPTGWRITAGSSATPDGVLSGSGSLGATWLDAASTKALHNLVLVTLSGPVQRADLVERNGIVPASFKGHFTVETEDGQRRQVLDIRNIMLVPATNCPARPR